MMTIEGRVWPRGKDEDMLELRYSASGTAWMRFNVAAYTGKTADGNPKPKIYWTVVCFGDLAERVATSLAPGDEVIVTGRAQANNWEDDEGRKHYDIEVSAYNIGASLKWNEVQPVRVEKGEGYGSTKSAPAPVAPAWDDSDAPF